MKAPLQVMFLCVVVLLVAFAAAQPPAKPVSEQDLTTMIGLGLDPDAIVARVKKAGIAFDAKLEPETVMRHIPAPRHRIEQQFKRPGLTSQHLTAEERRWCETFIWDGPLPSYQS